MGVSPNWAPFFFFFSFFLLLFALGLLPSCGCARQIVKRVLLKKQPAVPAECKATSFLPERRFNVSPFPFSSGFPLEWNITELWSEPGTLLLLGSTSLEPLDLGKCLFYKVRAMFNRLRHNAPLLAKGQCYRREEHIAFFFESN